MQNAAVAAAVAEEIFVAVAAGNSIGNAQNTNPASEPSACTVGAIDQTKTKAYFSNFGRVLDILSTSYTGGSNVLSGTSMASPYVADLAAYLLALEGPRTAGALCNRIVQLAPSGVKGLPAGSPDKIAYNSNGA